MNRLLALSILRFVLGLVISGYSVALAISQLRGSTHSPLLALAIAETVAAVLFLLPKTMRLGGVALIIIFALAAALHVAHGEYNVAYLAIYAAAALAVISDGSRYERH